jgi:uncharacterized damage-inducible protein DinB
MQTTISKASVYTGMLDMQAGIFNNAFDGINDKDAVKRPNEQVNHLNWLLGHLATCRLMLLNLIGGNAADPYFNIYFKSISEENKYPSLKEIKENWDFATNLLIEKIESISEEEMETEIPGKGGGPRDFISFFIYHEAYHLGQIGYARKLLGLPVLKSA